ncbi:hypothetical protein DOTSEDRAFT_136395, partial [Dothistroma septosporum NZE10]
LHMFDVAATVLSVLCMRVVMYDGIERLIGISEYGALQDKSEQDLENRQLLVR